jgi:hypothetical protein
VERQKLRYARAHNKAFEGFGEILFFLFVTPFFSLSLIRKFGCVHVRARVYARKCDFGAATMRVDGATTTRGFARKPPGWL